MNENISIIESYMFITVHMGITVYIVIKFNTKATGDMIFYHLNHLDINTRKLLIQFDRCPLRCTGACEGEMANLLE